MKSNKGFTLIELLVSVSVLLFGVAIFLGVVVGGIYFLSHTAKAPASAQVAK